jgi:hypothetical protein
MADRSLVSCHSCGGFAPAAHTACPHCDASLTRPLGRIARFLGALAGSGAFMMTMAACYGVAPHQATMPDPENCVDGDGDGVCAPQDCNDADGVVFPGAEDVEGDAIDQNCDGVDGWADPAATPPSEPEPDPAAAAAP